MSNYTTTTIVGWDSRNKKKGKKAEVWCANYGLKRLLKNLFIGKLYVRERKTLSMNLEKLFSNKTDEVLITTLCRDCHDSLVPEVQEKAKELPNFEILSNK